MRPILPLLLVAGLLGACAHRGAAGAAAVEPTLDTIEIDGQVFRIHYWPEDAAAAAMVTRALIRAVPLAARWGRMDREVTITLHPSHAALEAAVHREGYAWLRAWARYQTIDLQSPRTWGWFGAKEREVDELILHELTHCAMYQAAASEWTWPHKGIPLWFREGMASVTAGQGYRRTTAEGLWHFYANSLPGAGDGYPSAAARAARGFTSQDGDPVTDPEPLYQERSDVVYGAAHRAFEFLRDRYGEEQIRKVMALMHGGRAFEQAFEEAIGIPETAFAAEFRRYVLWQGWR